MKANRQDKIIEIIQQNDIETQEELADKEHRKHREKNGDDRYQDIGAYYHLPESLGQIPGKVCKKPDEAKDEYCREFVETGDDDFALAQYSHNLTITLRRIFSIIFCYISFFFRSK